AHQPVYLPWLGLFHKIALADHFCVFDVAQYQTKDFNNRNKIKTNAGAIWLTVPVESKGHFEKQISTVRIINNGWNRKHLKSIELAYKKAPFFDEYFPPLEALLQREFTLLTDLNTQMLELLLRQLGIDVPISLATALGLEGKKSDLVLDMCLKLGASEYVFGAQGRNYANIENFLGRGVRPHFQSYVHPVYKQLHGAFEPYMSVIDLLYNTGPSSLSILMSGNLKELKQIPPPEPPLRA
ncbi:MAG: WbqC family protein, partial [Candidatus Eremiobacteraeota bacterium]|nr:WbqC family protein [Candidatus Eremiobacteraeota bacterium]